MNVHSSVGVNPPGPTTSEPFAPEARYELKIDTDGDAAANISYEVRCASVEGGEQTATLCRVESAQAAETGAGGKVIVEGVPVSTGHEGHVTEAGDHRFFAGWRSDPFFFDVLGTLNKFQFTSGVSSQTKILAASCWKCPTLFLGRKRLGCGLAR
jgi:hypothetical protein